MAYRVKDLMINIVGAEGQGPDCGALTKHACHTLTALCPVLTWTTTPGGTACPGATQFCEGISTGNRTFLMFCANATGYCPGGSWTLPTHWTPYLPTCPIVSHCPTESRTVHTDAAAASEQLAMLKAHLKEALEEIERQEEVVNEQAQPQTHAEIEELEAKMKEALAELSKRKSELKE
jgi:hypothetical protein